MINEVFIFCQSRLKQTPLPSKQDAVIRLNVVHIQKWLAYNNNPDDTRMYSCALIQLHVVN